MSDKRKGRHGWKREILEEVMDGDLNICQGVKREEKGTVRAVVSYLQRC